MAKDKKDKKAAAAEAKKKEEIEKAAASKKEKAAAEINLNDGAGASDDSLNVKPGPPADVTLYWIHPVYSDGTMNPPSAYGFTLEPTKEGYHMATMGVEAARVELMRKHVRAFMSEKDYKFLLRAKKDGEKKK